MEGVVAGRGKLQVVDVTSCARREAKVKVTVLAVARNVKVDPAVPASTYSEAGPYLSRNMSKKPGS